MNRRSGAGAAGDHAQGRVPAPIPRRRGAAARSLELFVCRAAAPRSPAASRFGEKGRPRLLPRITLRANGILAGRFGGKGRPRPAHRGNPSSGMPCAGAALPAAGIASGISRPDEGRAGAMEAGARAGPAPHGPCSEREGLAAARPVPRHSAPAAAAGRPGGARCGWQRPSPPSSPLLRATGCARRPQARSLSAAASVHIFPAGPARHVR